MPSLIGAQTPVRLVSVVLLGCGGEMMRVREIGNCCSGVMFTLGIIGLQPPGNTNSPLLQVHQVLRNISRDAEVDHPVHHVEAEEHDGEDHPAVLVYVTPSHPEYSVRGFGRGEGGKGELYGLGEGRTLATPILTSAEWMAVVKLNASLQLK